MNVEIYIQGQKLDLFEDENISITSNVKDVRDLSLKADFSQSFTVPASDNNNTIFKRWYNFDIDNGFDARTRVDASIDVNTVDFKRGKIRLEKAELENGSPVNYTITFFGTTVKLKDLIGDDKLFDLTWLSNFDHDYTNANLLTGLTTGLDFTVGATTYEEAIIYPLISYQRQWLYNSDSTDTTSTDSLVNIAYDSGRTDGVKSANLKPAIKLDLILKAIQEEYGLTFTGNFFDTERWQKIYMPLHNDDNILGVGVLEFENVNDTAPAESPDTADQLIYRCSIIPDAGFEDVGYTLKLEINGVTLYESTTPLFGPTQKIGYEQNPPGDFNAVATLTTVEDFEFSANTTVQHFYLDGFTPTYTNIFSNSYINQVIDLYATITELVQDIGVYEFLQSILKMFNLVVVADGDDLYFNDLDNWYTEGQIYDVTPYIDTVKKSVKKGKIYNKIDFLFEESEQILSDNYREREKIGYGDIEIEFNDADGNPLDGDKLEITTLFQNPMYERLFDLDTNDELDFQYCLMLDKSLNTVVGNPFLFYAPSTSVINNPIGFKDTATYQEINTAVYMPSHSIQLDTGSFNLNFGAVINEFTSEVFLDTIYDRYFSDWITDVFSIKRRLIEVKGILPVNLLHRLELNDRLIINDTRYIINKITSNLTTREDSFELINDIYDAPLASDEINTSVFRNTYRRYNSGVHDDTANYIGVDNKTAAKVDTGYGTSWVTITNPKSVGVTSEIAFTIDENLTGAERTMQIQVTDSLNDPKFTIYQYEKDIAVANFSNAKNIAHLINLINTRI